MASVHTLVVVLALSVGIVWGDLYLHHPRGSNNRLNERTATRTNANRMFDSQVRIGNARNIVVDFLFILDHFFLLLLFLFLRHSYYSFV